MRFLKLTKFVINMHNVSYIEKSTDSFCIVLNRAPFIDGFLFAGSGAVSSQSKVINVMNDGKTNDYETVKKWMTKIDDI